MSKKENKKAELKDEKYFDIDEFYRKLGVWLLILLLIVILTIGSVLLIMQNAILKSIEPNYMYKSKVRYIDTEDLNNIEKNKEIE